MSRETVKNLIEMVPESRMESLYRFVIKLIPEDEPLQDEIEALEEGKRDREKNGTIPHDAINWD